MGRRDNFAGIASAVIGLVIIYDRGEACNKFSFLQG